MIRTYVAAASLLAVFSVAQAQTQAAGFQVSGTGVPNPVLLSDVGGVTEFAFGGDYSWVSGPLASAGSVISNQGRAPMDYVPMNFAFSVQDGYSVTGIDFTGSVNGSITTTPFTGSSTDTVLTPGGGTSTFGASLTVGSLSDSVRLNNITSAQSFEASLTGLDLEGSFQLGLLFDYYLTNSPITYTHCPVPWWCTTGVSYNTTTALSYGDMRMTIHTAANAPIAAPVPEPETYALMLAGLGVVGAVARRRRRA